MNIDITTGRSFEDLQADFYHYLRDSEGGNLAPKTSGDYISRMRFLSRLYTLDDRITKEKVDEIMKREKQLVQIETNIIPRMQCLIYIRD